MPALPDDRSPASLYLDLLKRCLTRTGFPERFAAYRSRSPVRRALVALATAFSRKPLALVRRVVVDPEAREMGRDWPADAETMIGWRRLSHLADLVRDVVAKDVPGDLPESGVWRGGASILMRAALEVCGDRSRRVFACDSFEGLPPPDPARYPADEGLNLHEKRQLAISLDEVKANFARYGYLDDRVVFVRGWFRDTLPTLAVDRLAILRLDGDLYASTIEALDALYRKVSVGGYVVVDDYGAIEACKKAVEDFRAREGVREPIEAIDDYGVFWRRER